MTARKMLSNYSKYLVKNLRREKEGRGRNWAIDNLMATYKRLAIFNHYYHGWDYEKTARWGINKVRMSSGQPPINRLH